MTHTLSQITQMSQGRIGIQWKSSTWLTSLVACSTAHQAKIILMQEFHFSLQQFIYFHILKENIFCSYNVQKEAWGEEKAFASEEMHSQG